MIPVILSGGSGSRLWPQSRQSYPKQFLPLVSDKTMIQETVQRVKCLSAFAPLVICSQEHRFLVAEQLQGIGVSPEAILLEPCSRNTAPAVAVAALHALENHDNPLLLVLPADHVIRDMEAFKHSIEIAADAARAGALVTFGIIPSRAETGYGYIRRGAESLAKAGSYIVDRFVEKPDAAHAAKYILSGDYYWNSGMFIASASRILEELEIFAPEILSQCRLALHNAKIEFDFTWLDPVSFGECANESIDYAVMEKTEQAVVVPLNAEWSDIGSWQSLWDISDLDDQGNAARGHTLAVDSHNCLISSERSLIATLGVSDLVVVESDNAILVTNRSRSQDVKEIVKVLEAKSPSYYREHRKVYRPWGYYDTVDFGDRFKVKRIMVKSGHCLSLQHHHHRAEHWIVVSGTALVMCDSKEFLLTENQSTFIPLGAMHRLSNPGKVDLFIIEIQSGSYLGEDDIVRFDDSYGRE